MLVPNDYIEALERGLPSSPLPPPKPQHQYRNCSGLPTSLHVTPRVSDFYLLLGMEHFPVHQKTYFKKFMTMAGRVDCGVDRALVQVLSPSSFTSPRIDGNLLGWHLASLHQQWQNSASAINNLHVLLKFTSFDVMPPASGDNRSGISSG